MRPPPIPLAVVGAGRVTRAVHLPLLRRVPGSFRVVAVVDTDRERAEAAAAEFTGAVAATDLDDAFAAGAGAVLCATPWYTHAEIVRRALERDLHVLCEKPVTLDRDELRSLVAAERRAAGSVGVGYMKRHDRAVQALIEHIREAREELRHISVRVIDPNAPHQVRDLLPPDFTVGDSAAPAEARLALDRAVDGRIAGTRRYAFAHPVGGSLVHHINVVQAMLAGSGCELRGAPRQAVHWAAGTSVACCWRLSDDLTVQMSYVRVPGSRVYAETVECVTGAEVLTLSAPSPYAPGATCTLRIDGHREDFGATSRVLRAPGPETGFARQLAAWAAGITSGVPTLPGLSEALRDLQVVHEIVAALN